jgi:SAM-dependent methyltransferase
MSGEIHSPEEPSSWVERFAPLVRAGGVVLDVACGSGRHTRLMVARGHPVVAVDRSAQALEALAGVSGVRAVAADLEADDWPFSGQRFAAVIVTNYLHRPLLPILVDSLEGGGVLLYETFAAGNERFGRPSNRAFLLERGELLRATQGLRVVAYEDLQIGVPRPSCVQRLCAVRGEVLQWQP